MKRSVYSFCGHLPHMDDQRHEHQQGPTYNSSVPLQDEALKTNRKRWTIEKYGERRSGSSVLMGRHDDGDDDTLSDEQFSKYSIS